MWNYRKNDYAANKYSPNIVYRFNDEIIEISLEDYLEENPDRTEQRTPRPVKIYLSREWRR